MNVQVTTAGPEDRARIQALFELYVHDLSEMLGIDVEPDGRHAFLIRVDEKLAGFALVQQRSRLTGDESTSDVAEFFIVRKYQVRPKAQNLPATAFWRRAIGRYTNNQFEEVILDDERWRGTVQRFNSEER